MNQSERDRWISEALDEVFAALAAHETTQTSLIFKGARVLNRRLERENRQSLDIDTNLTEDFIHAYPERTQQREVLEQRLTNAIRSHLGHADPVRYELIQLKITPQPPNYHPQGWDAFKVRLNLTDLKYPRTRGLPALDLDIAAPEQLSPLSVAPLVIGKHEVIAYSLERIAGEKLRAYLSTLPEYRRKTHKPGEAIRVKDLYDLNQIERTHPLTNPVFWDQVGQEFRLACESRGVDCRGRDTFFQSDNEVASAYQADSTIPKHNANFNEVIATLERIVAYMTQVALIPFEFPLPKPLIPESNTR